ncbi:hypothetical protein ACFSZS_30130 [Seohaeicola zhoushanensis]
MFPTEEQTLACQSLRRFLDDRIEHAYLALDGAPMEKAVIQGFLKDLAGFGLTAAPHPEEVGEWVSTG